MNNKMRYFLTAILGLAAGYFLFDVLGALFH